MIDDFGLVRFAREKKECMNADLSRRTMDLGEWWERSFSQDALGFSFSSTNWLRASENKSLSKERRGMNSGNEELKKRLFSSVSIQSFVGCRRKDMDTRDVNSEREDVLFKGEVLSPKTTFEWLEAFRRTAARMLSWCSICSHSNSHRTSKALPVNFADCCSLRRREFTNQDVC